MLAVAIRKELLADRQNVNDSGAVAPKKVIWVYGFGSYLNAQTLSYSGRDHCERLDVSCAEAGGTLPHQQMVGLVGPCTFEVGHVRVRLGKFSGGSRA
jgi:hypothetical protein